MARTNSPATYIFEEGLDSTPCYGVEDGLDGYCVHNPACPHYPHSWTGPNSNCVNQSWYFCPPVLSDLPPPLEGDDSITSYYPR